MERYGFTNVDQLATAGLPRRLIPASPLSNGPGARLVDVAGPATSSGCLAISASTSQHNERRRPARP
jgi:hypothetical protein